MKKLLAVVFILISTPGLSQPWIVLDLGRLHRSDHCMAAAAQTFQSMLGELRIARLYASDWVTYADGLQGRHDALITCTYGNNGGTRATLVVYSHPGESLDPYFRRRLDQVFRDRASAVTQAWKDRYR